MRLLGLSLLSAVLVSAPSAFARPEHNAFLNQPVTSVSQLLAELHKDPQVLHRYERHFKMSEPTLAHYFRSLHLEPLKQEKRYLVFNVDDSYVIRHRLLHLKKGTLVFADATHKPVLKRSCGNPMVAYLPALGEKSAKLYSQPSSAATRAAQADSPLEALAQDDSSSLSGTAPAIPSESLLADTTEPTGNALAITPTPTTPMTSPDFAPSALGVDSTLGLAGLAGLAGLGFNHGGGGGGTTPAVVPEPASFVPFALGAIGLYGARRRNRR